MKRNISPALSKDGKWFIATCPNFPGANGQGKTPKEAKKSFHQAMKLILKDRREDKNNPVQKTYGQRGRQFVETRKQFCKFCLKIFLLILLILSKMSPR